MKTLDEMNIKIHKTREEFEACKDDSCSDKNCQFTRLRAKTLEQSEMTNPNRTDPDVP